MTVGHFGWRHQYNNRNNTMQIVTKAPESSMFSDFISGRSSNSSPVWLSLWIYAFNMKMNGPLCDCVNHNNHTQKISISKRTILLFLCFFFVEILQSGQKYNANCHKNRLVFFNHNVKIENIPNLKRFLCISFHSLIEEKPENSFQNESVSLD